MYLLAAIPFALAAAWLVVVVYRLAALNARLRANLAGCTGYPISPSFRRPAASPSPLGTGQGRAAERLVFVREMSRDGTITVHRWNGRVLLSAVESAA